VEFKSQNLKIMKRKNITIIKLILFIVIFASIQINNKSSFSQSPKDTLEAAKQLRNGGKFKEAFSLLEKYQADHPSELNAAWLCAQTAAWMKHYKASEKEYEKAIQIDTHNAYLLLEYDMMLVNSGDLEKVKPLLRTYYSWDPTNSSVLIALAKISLWQGDYNDAEWFVGEALYYNPNDKSAIEILNEIRSAKSPWSEMSIAHTSDDQPMKTTTPAFEGGFYNSALSFMHFSLQVPTFITDYNTVNALWFQAGNKSVFSKQNMNISIDLGLLKYPSGNNIGVTGNLQLDKTFLRHLIFSVQAERKPYFYTLSSLDDVVADNHYSVSATWSDPNKWNLRTAFDLDHFNDDNSISTFSAWCMTPPLKVSIFELHAGYGFNFSTSTENRFAAVKTLSEIIDSSYYHLPINGIYSPYFTPNKQFIHSAIASITLHLSRTLDIATKVNYGFSAVTQCPYLYLNEDASENAYVAKGYFKEKYSPVNFNINAAWKLTKKISLKAEYIYSKTNFYKNNYLGIGIKMSFWNENK